MGQQGEEEEAPQSAGRGCERRWRGGGIAPRRTGARPGRQWPDRGPREDAEIGRFEEETLREHGRNVEEADHRLMDAPRFTPSHRRPASSGRPTSAGRIVRLLFGFSSVVLLFDVVLKLLCDCCRKLLHSLRSQVPLRACCIAVPRTQTLHSLHDYNRYYNL